MFSVCGEVGGFGRYQWLHVTLISLPGLFMASQNLLNNFVSGIPAHHCRLPANYSLNNLSHYQVLCLIRLTNEAACYRDVNGLVGCIKVIGCFRWMNSSC